ncbi:MAG: DUF1189 domain-containing protein [Clostridia bacterium]|nr:DUF1189 domain-containing protein [Clostridia bacterium]
MDKITPNFLSKFIGSISNFNSYTVFTKLTVGKAFSYLFLLTVLLGTISLIRPVYEFNNGIASFITTFNDQVPDFALQNGKLSVSGKMPITIQDGNQPIIIDTTDQTPVEVLDQYPQGILVLSDRMIQKRVFDTRTTEFSSMAGFSITKADVAGWIPLLKWFSIAIILFGLIGFFIGKIFSALVVSLIALVINSISKANLSYSNLFKISAYALTLPIVLKVLLGLASANVPFFFLIYYGLAAFYVGMALKYIKQETLPDQELRIE